jgi:hypothetical protein
MSLFEIDHIEFAAALLGSNLNIGGHVPFGLSIN